MSLHWIADGRVLRTPLAALALALALPAVAAADTGRHEAAADALAALHVKTSRKPVTVYALTAPVAAGTRVTQAGRRLPARGGRGTFPAPLVATASEPSWLFYADDAPATNFAHAGRVVLVGRDSGRVTLRKTGFAPLVAGELPAFLSDQSAYNAARYRIFERRWQTAPVARAASAPARTYDAFGATGPVSVQESGARQLTADALAAEGSCVVRVSDALTDFYDFAGVDRSRAAAGRVLRRARAAEPEARLGALHATGAARARGVPRPARARARLPAAARLHRGRRLRAGSAGDQPRDARVRRKPDADHVEGPARERRPRVRRRAPRRGCELRPRRPVHRPLRVLRSPICPTSRR